MEQDQNFRRLLIRNDVKELSRISDFLEKLWDDWKLPPKLIYSINLVLEEAISNIIFYAFDDELVHLIGLEFRREGDQMSMILIDGGKPFNPILTEDPDTKLSVEDRPIGGLGIYLIKQFMDNVYYQRLNEKNQFTMIKTIVPEIQESKDIN